jgi:hypothetical protein
MTCSLSSCFQVRQKRNGVLPRANITEETDFSRKQNARKSDITAVFGLEQTFDTNHLEATGQPLTALVQPAGWLTEERLPRRLPELNARLILPFQD